eukprot:CAMPEP_0172515012 /NCGR_PEP_ID=MMETSP1066-20121228/264578_1 /TAXON_ID=671091 /ORGANISM="Coscinodiscus wailesii, Strain CCMP2513" /LENGTH=444 /DNA_ID=CAMNT_0013295903 /DNA_START=360 /DNA_END=1694 /DNA_ORIENTATION=+
MEVGRIAKWNKSEGESFIAGDVICEIETDKATVDFEAQDDGILAKILIGDLGGDEFKVGVPIAVVVEEEEYKDSFKDFHVEAAVEKQEFPPDTIIAEKSESPVASASGENKLGEFTLLPSARHLSHSKGVDATSLYPGSGKDGRVTKGDVLKALQDGVNLPPLNTVAKSAATTAAPVAGAATATPPTAASLTAPSAPITPPPIPEVTDNPYEDIPNNNMRKVIARRLTESKATVPHFYTTTDIDIDPILALRKRLAAIDVKVSVNDVIVRASALALRDVPEMNAMYKGGEVKMSDSVDICVAVATPTGLITPIVPKTDEMGLSQINDKVKDLATRARDNKLKPEEYQGGTFTISNLGMFGINEFTAVINPPQCAILAVGSGVKKVTSATKIQDGDEDTESYEYGFKTMMSARLSADRRVVDEAISGLYLQTLKQYLENPNLLML